MVVVLLLVVLLLVLLLMAVFLPITFSLYLVKQMMMNLLLLRVISVFEHQCRSHRHLLLQEILQHIHSARDYAPRPHHPRQPLKLTPTSSSKCVCTSSEDLTWRNQTEDISRT